MAFSISHALRMRSTRFNTDRSSAAATDPAVFDDVWQGAPVRTDTGNTTIDAVTGLPSYSFVDSVYPSGTATNAAAMAAF
jgi:hypothetical protein